MARKTNFPIVFITRMDGGGLETFCLGLLRAWVAQGVWATLYLSFSGGVHENDIPEGIDRVCWNVRARWCALRLARWLRARPDSPCFVLNQELAVVLLALKRLHIIRNRIYFSESTDVNRHYGSLFKKLMCLFWPYLDGIMEQSKAGLDETNKICKGRLPKSCIVRNIIQLPENGGGFVLGNHTCRLSCVGSFKPMKGQEYLIRELYGEKMGDWMLDFWGEGERKASSEHMVAAFNLSDIVHFNGWQHNTAIIYDSCDIVVIPSDYEGLPNVMLEAILYGKRVSVRPTCVGACELLKELGLPETWPWRKVLEIPVESWDKARNMLAEICNPSKVAETIFEFMSK